MSLLLAVGIRFLSAWIDFIFPPLCAYCKEYCDTQLFCPSCWDLCVPPDPSNRCIHCFEEIEENGICSHCVRAPLLSSPYAYVFDLTRPAQLLVARYRPTPKILAAFVMNQWHSLNWPIPDIVVPIRQTREIAKVFAAWLEIPSIPLLSSASNNWHCATDRVEEDLIYLLLVWDQSVEELEQILSALSEVFPKKVYILSLF